MFADVPAQWQDSTLGELCARSGGNIQTGPFGSQLHASDYVQYGIPSIMPENLTDDRISTDDIARISQQDARRLNRYLVQRGDILYSRRGDVTKRALAEKEHEGWLCGTGCLRIRFGDGQVRSRYAFYYLGHPLVKDWIVRHAIGATLPNLNTSILSALPFLVPPPREQEAISEILGALDDKIELNRRMNETLEAMARALFKAWFVDFEPVRAKMEGRWKPGQSLPGLPAHLYDLFPSRLVDSELGEIPEGWKVGTIGDLAEIVGGSTPSTTNSAYWADGQYHWATPKDLSKISVPVLLETERKITDAGLAQISSGLLPPGTVLLSSRAPIGYLAIAEVPIAVNQGFIAMKPRKGVSSVFLLLWAGFASDDILSRANGSTFQEISKANFRPIPLVEAPPAVMHSFDETARPLFNRIVCNERESETLAALRDALLPKLISGQIRLTESERFLEGARDETRSPTTSGEGV